MKTAKTFVFNTDEKRSFDSYANGSFVSFGFFVKKTKARLHFASKIRLKLGFFSIINARIPAFEILRMHVEYNSYSICSTNGAPGCYDTHTRFNLLRLVLAIFSFAKHMSAFSRQLQM